MGGETEAFSIALPTAEDLDVAAKAWHEGHSQIEFSQGSIWYRVVSSVSPLDVPRFARTCYSSPALNRFTPVQRAGSIAPAAYAAKTEATALWEVVLREIRHAGVRRVPVSATRDRYLCEVELNRPLRALTVCRPLDGQLVVEGKRPPDLTAAWPSAYGATRAWAQALYERLPGLDAICYESHQVGGECIVVFQPAGTPVFELRGDPQPVNKDPIRSLAAQQARIAGAVIDFDDDDDHEDDC